MDNPAQQARAHRTNGRCRIDGLSTLLEAMAVGDLISQPRKIDPLVVDSPAGLAQQPGDLAIALRRAVLPERRTGATLGHMQLRSHLLNAGTATRGA